MAGVDLQNALEEAQGVQAEHGDRLGATWLPTTGGIKSYDYLLQLATIIHISNKLADSAQLTKPRC